MWGEPMSESTNRLVSRKGALVTLLCTAPVAFLVGHFSDFDRGFTAWAFSVAIVAACTLCWDMKGRPGFWLGVVLLVGIHTLLVVRVPWHYSGAAYMPVMLLDIGVDGAVLTLLAKFMKRRRDQAAVG